MTGKIQYRRKRIKHKEDPRAAIRSICGGIGLINRDRKGVNNEEIFNNGAGCGDDFWSWSDSICGGIVFRCAR